MAIAGRLYQVFCWRGTVRFGPGRLALDFPFRKGACTRPHRQGPTRFWRAGVLAPPFATLVGGRVLRRPLHPPLFYSPFFRFCIRSNKGATSGSTLIIALVISSRL